MEHFVLLIPAFTWHQVFEKCLLTSGGLFMSQWFFLWTPVCFFFISLTFPCICEGANDSLTGMLSGRWCLSNGGASALYWVLVCVSVCVCRKSGGIVRTWPAHFACSSRDRCFWASTGAWQLPFIAVFSTLNPWPALPSSSSSSSSSLLSSLPLSTTSDLFSRRLPRPSWVMDCEG